MVNHRYAIFGHITIMPLAYIIELYLYIGVWLLLSLLEFKKKKKKVTGIRHNMFVSHVNPYLILKLF